MSTDLILVDVEHIEALHRLAAENAGNAVQYAIACGRELQTVKAHLGHGKFGKWCEGLTFSYDTVAAYMRAAKVAPNIERAQEMSLRGLLASAKAERKEGRREKVIGLAEHASNKTADLSVLSNRGMRFGTIYADPPWLYGNQGTRGSTGDHYIGLSVDEICALPVAELVADSAHLHLWTTNAFLFDAKRVMEAWGFEYRSCFIWVKPQMGMGNYWRVSHEFLLLGIKGRAPFADRSLMSWGEFPRGKHSSKPEPIRSLIEKASAGPYLEMFARRPVRGWTVWGNEVELDVFNESEELAA